MMANMGSFNAGDAMGEEDGEKGEEDSDDEGALVFFVSLYAR